MEIFKRICFNEADYKNSKKTTDGRRAEALRILYGATGNILFNQYLLKIIDRWFNADSLCFKNRSVTMRARHRRGYRRRENICFYLKIFGFIAGEFEICNIF
ncbi:hypothetical protein [Comamonas sp.]|uniref:hypothetical protein n=1 Tax=Comamonas sp. TaxID=34028 RepID=UPI0028A0C799|nr:hypothetical protein [Comamonas sp.]